jgi:outer membrane biogenesis lipoprotein LolB
MKTLPLLSLALALATACSDQGNQASGTDAQADHAWKQQTQTLDKARGVEQTIMEGAEKQRRTLEEQSR